MNHFLQKHRVWFAVLVAVAIGAMVIFSLTNEEEDVPGNNEPSAPVRAVE